MVLVETTHLAKSFGSHRVFSDLNLRIETGEFVSLLGPSGCGKSTALRLIAGLENPTGGEIVRDPVCEAHQSMVFQDHQLLGWRTALENVRLPMEIRSQPKPMATPLARQGLNRLGLGASTEKYPHQLSGGMKMRVAIARSLILNPRLLLMDEPFAALDESTRFQLQEMIRELFESTKDMAVVFVTHSVAEAVFVSGRVLMFNGQGDIFRHEKILLPETRTASLRNSDAYYA